MASSTSSSNTLLRRHDSRQRGQRDQQELATPNFNICSPPDAPLDNDAVLIEFADALSVVERKIVVFVRHIDTYILKSGLLPDGESSTIRTKSVSEAQIALQEFESVQNSERRFSAIYLMDKSLLWYWDRMVKAFSIVLDFPGTDQSFKSRIFSELYLVQTYAEAIPNLLRHVAAKRKFNLHMRDALHQKWMKLDDMVTLWQNARGINSQINLPQWHTIEKDLNDFVNGVNLVPIRARKSRFEWKSTNVLIWLIFCFVCPPVLSTVGLHFSNNDKKGDVQDLAFWLFLQSCITQDVGLIMSIPGLWAQSSIPKFTWIAVMIIALILTTIAPILYNLLPTSYSLIMAMIAAAFQPFIIILITFAKRAEP